MPEVVTVESKNILKSKTFWANVVGGLVPVFVPAIPPAYAVPALGILNIVLRAITKQPVTVIPESLKQ